MNRHRQLLQIFVLGLGVLVLAGAGQAPAQNYPNRSVRWVLGFPPGGPTDIVVRLMGQSLSERMGQQFVIENRPGAGGNLATHHVVGSPPDGYTILAISHANAINATLYRKLPFDFMGDIAPVAGLVQMPNVLLVHPSLPARTVPQFIAIAKAHPGKINYASAGNGTSSHLAAEIFKAMTGIKMTHVPYRGAGLSLIDLVSGQVHVTISAISAPIEFIRAGKLRALGVTSATPSAALPGVPTVAATVPGYEVIGWFGVGVPKDTPAGIVDRLNREINGGLDDPKIRARLTDLGAAPFVVTPAQMARHIAAETEKWGNAVKFSGARLD